MKNFSLIYLELKQFIDRINYIKKYNINYDIIPELENKSQLRCMGRLWDAKNCDINKQCINRAVIDDLCKKCFKRNNLSGRVDEYPDEVKIIHWYKKYLNKIPNNQRIIENEININKFEKYLDIKTKKKKVFIIKKKMLKNKNETENENENKNFISIKSINNNNPSNIHDDYKKYITNNSLVDWWNDELKEKIKIYDSKNNSSCIFAIERTKEKNYLLNKNKVIVGEFNEWLSDIYSDELENIFDPYTNLPLNEYILYENTKIYHDLSAGKYLPYRYDNNTEELINTNAIEFL